MRKFLVALLLVPTLALADNARPLPPGGGPGPDPARAQKRMQLARTLGLASALDLDTEQALKLGQAMAKFDDRRKAIRDQAREAREALRTAATGGKASAGDVDGAVAKLLELRAQSQALDKELLQAVTQNLTPQQKARAVLFLGSFRHRMDRHMMMRHAMGGGPGGPGCPEMTNGAGPGHMGHGGAMMDREPGGRMSMRGPGGWDDDAADAPEDP